MKKIVVLMILCGAVNLFSACSAASKAEPEATAVEYAKVCALENNGKRVMTEGFLELGATSFCSGSKGEISCRLNFKEKPDGGDNFPAYVYEGTGANQMEKLAKDYKPGDLKLRGDDNSLIAPPDKVRITGDLMATKDPATEKVSCFINVKKIEKR